MCNAAGLAMGALSMIANTQAQEAQIEAQNAAYMENIRASQQAKVDSDRQANLKQAQADEAAAEEMFDNDLVTRELAARSVVAGGESGISGGNTNTQIIGNILQRGLAANTRITQNLGREQAQIGEERLGFTSQYQSRVNSVSRGGKINRLGALAGGAQAGFGAAYAADSLGLFS